MEASGIEKRKLERLNINLLAECVVDGLSFGITVTDISSGGLKFEAFKKIETGTNVGLMLNMDDMPPLRLEGEIRWREKLKIKWLYGVRFTEMSDEDASQLRQMVQRIFWANFNG